MSIEPSTRRGYLSEINERVKALLGSLPVGWLDAEVLDSFYTELARAAVIVNHAFETDPDWGRSSGLR